ncbi:hypothetical protein F5B22DRAFT_600368 [Xylaria bambusicola]|uniref:uncharacterized protein n=1 Tax=Xylaria bambusicola TaxID=326684 RepID=UPI0020082A9B|nr:uncharacterized protein F5B22DRAFT_600368 [Xylaria bambusicola]KAI0518227.1 hypothetical protein F5B22DRAFT_600368 [Xylaria bambusicola]
MASRTTYIPRFLLPQYSPMWRTATRSAALARALNVEVGQVMVRYASNTAARRPAVAKDALAKVATQRAASTKAGAATKAAKASAPTKAPSKHAAKTSASSSRQPVDPKTAPAPTSTTPAPSTEKPRVQAAAPKTAAAPPKADPSKPIVLEKPERFNPPSHGSRLPRSTPRHYGGSMTAEEVKLQSRRTYPGLPPPPNTWSHWFINNRGIHIFITLGTLTSLALFTFAQNFKAKSPFADLVPPISEFPRHPFQYIGVCLDVLRMHEEHESAQTAEKRRRKVDDIAKREEYRKAHGLEPVRSGFLGAKAAEPAPSSAVETVDDASPVIVVETLAAEPNATAESTSEGKRKKFLGIF